jgi:hypothetical protein
MLTSRSPPLFGSIVNVQASGLPEVVLAVRLDNGSLTYVDADARGSGWDFDEGERISAIREDAGTWRRMI